MNKLILDLCGGTGSWSRPYKVSGYDVELITLPAWDVKKVEFGDYAMTFFRQDVRWVDTKTVIYKDVYGILAAPPCTEFSLAKGGQPRDFESGVEVLEACLQIIWHCRIHTKIAFWALENPVGFMRQFMGRPHYTFEHWQHGDIQIKPTDVWGYFKEPTAAAKERPEELNKKYPKGSSNGRGWAAPECPKEYEHLGLDRAALRAITPTGFAQAFYRANK